MACAIPAQPKKSYLAQLFALFSTMPWIFCLLRRWYEIWRPSYYCMKSGHQSTNAWLKSSPNLPTLSFIRTAVTCTASHPSSSSASLNSKHSGQQSFSSTCIQFIQHIHSVLQRQSVQEAFRKRFSSYIRDQFLQQMQHWSLQHIRHIHNTSNDSGSYNDNQFIRHIDYITRATISSL
jgi:hypothetical protein